MKKIINWLIVLLVLILHYDNGYIQTFNNVEIYTVTSKYISILTENMDVPLYISRDKIIYWEEGERITNDN